jgi:hypothetical protein
MSDLRQRATPIVVELVTLDLGRNSVGAWERAKELLAGEDRDLLAMVIVLLNSWAAAGVQSLANVTGEDPMTALQEFALKQQRDGFGESDASST